MGSGTANVIGSLKWFGSTNSLHVLTIEQNKSQSRIVFHEIVFHFNCKFNCHTATNSFILLFRVATAFRSVYISIISGEQMCNLPTNGDHNSYTCIAFVYVIWKCFTIGIYKSHSESTILFFLIILIYTIILTYAEYLI